MVKVSIDIKDNEVPDGAHQEIEGAAVVAITLTDTDDGIKSLAFIHGSFNGSMSSAILASVEDLMGEAVFKRAMMVHMLESMAKKIGHKSGEDAEENPGSM